MNAYAPHARLSHPAVTAAALLLAAVGASRSFGQTAVTWTAAGNGVWSNIGGWSGGVVPVNSGSATFDVTLDGARTIVVDAATPTSFALNDLILRQPTTLDIQFGRVLTVNQDCSIGGILQVSGPGSFTATGPGSRLEGTGRLRATGGGRIDLMVGPYNGAPIGGTDVLFSATGTSAGGVASEINLTGMNTLNFGAGGGRHTHTISATLGGVVRLNGLRTIQAVNGEDDILDFVASGGGRIELNQLETIGATGNGSDRVRFSVGTGSVLSVPSLTTASRIELIVTGTGSVTMPSLVNLQSSVLNLTSASQFRSGSLSNINNSRLSVAGGVQWGGSATAANGRVTATSYTANFTGTALSATGSGSVLDLSSLTAFTTAWDDNWSGVQTTNIVASDGGTVNLSGVQTLTTSTRGEDRTDILMSTGGTVNLNALTTIGGGGRTRFSVGTGMSYTLPALTTAGNLTADLEGGATFTAPALTRITSGGFGLAVGSSLQLPALTELTGSTLSLVPGATVRTGELGNIGSTRLSVAGGVQWGGSATAANGRVTATSYTANFVGTALSATGSGSVLDLSSLTALTTAWDDGWAGVQTTNILASDGGVVNLSGVQTLITSTRGEDRTDIVVGTGGAVNFNGLTTITGGGRARFAVGAGTSYALPSLATAANLSVDLDTGAGFSAPQLVRVSGAGFTLGAGSSLLLPALTELTGSTLNLAPGATVRTADLANINASRLNVSGGVQWGGAATSANGRVTATSYTANFVGTALSATGLGSVLDLSSLTAFTTAWDDGWSGVQTTNIVASDGGRVNLSGLQTIVASTRGEDRTEFTASRGGRLNLGQLSSISGSGRVIMTASQGGTLEFADLSISTNASVTVADLDSGLSVSRSLFLRGGNLSVPGGGTLSIGKHLYNQTTDEATANLTQTILQFASPGLHLLEVGGRDLGAMDPANNGNFGIGRIEVGLPGAPASLQLLELFNNGNRGSNLPEALYLYGIGQGTPLESLVLHSGSILYLDNINVYARENGQWIWLNSLFGTSQTVVPYGGGYLHLPSPGAAALVVLAGVVAARRRR